jgi:hypothetical protein
MRQTLLHFGRRQVPLTRKRKASWLGAIAGLTAYLPRQSLSRITCADMKKHDFATSTQRLGVRFTEGLRTAFRFRWLRKL